MDCREAQEHILDELVEPLAGDRVRAVETHIATCETCHAFAATQRTLDARLTAAMPAAHLSAGFRSSLNTKLGRDSVAAWPDFLPDLAHLAGCAVATGVAALVLPVAGGTVILAGAVFTSATYFLQSVVRSALDGVEGDA